MASLSYLEEDTDMMLSQSIKTEEEIKQEPVDVSSDGMPDVPDRVNHTSDCKLEASYVGVNDIKEEAEPFINEAELGIHDDEVGDNVSETRIDLRFMAVQAVEYSVHPDHNAVTSVPETKTDLHHIEEESVVYSSETESGLLHLGNEDNSLSNDPEMPLHHMTDDITCESEAKTNWCHISEDTSQHLLFDIHYKVKDSEHTTFQSNEAKIALHQMAQESEEDADYHVNGIKSEPQSDGEDTCNHSGGTKIYTDCNVNGIKSEPQSEAEDTNDHSSETKFNLHHVTENSGKEADYHVTRIKFEPQFEGGDISDQSSGTDINMHDLAKTNTVKLQEKQHFKCNQCDRSFTRSGNLKRHLLQHKEDKKCHQCDKMFSTASCLRRHMQTHTGEKPFICNLCDKRFTQAGSLKQHLLIHQERERFNCHLCDKSFVYISSLNIHMTKHSEPMLKCEHCDKRFNHSKFLKAHLLTHSGKPFMCEYCDKRFSQSSDLKRHLRVHTGIKPFMCEYCGREFSQSAHYKQHRLKVHEAAKQQEFLCYLCKKSFQNSESLKTHVKIHFESHKIESFK